ncbi:MAG: T9SS type A sorting domain-containing protein, partial [Bacteroidales bacterium]|nr:T9SS type A sorting domain-containing protein [Bacteroidales bacterium]
VYDLQGRMVARQAVDGIVTTIATEDWPSGVYLWKVLQDGNLSESGKWVKE